jgi:hypothetical protein
MTDFVISTIGTQFCCSNHRITTSSETTEKGTEREWYKTDVKEDH